MKQLKRNESNPNKSRNILTKNDKKRLAEALGVNNIDEDILARLQQAADEWLVWSTCVFAPRPGKCRSKLKSVNKHASSLKKELSDVLFTLRFVNNIVLLHKELDHIIKKTKELLVTIPTERRGRSAENIPEKILIDMLIPIYKDATNEKPTLYGKSRNHNADFPEFIRAFLSLEQYPKSHLVNDGLRGVLEDMIKVTKK